MAFPQIKDVNLEILSKLDDKDLGSMCSTNKYFRDLCKNEDFWRNRTVNRFGKVLGDYERINKYRIEYGYDTWRNYYISLIDFLEKLYSRKEISSQNRQDLSLLKNEIEGNLITIREELNYRFKEYKWKQMLNWDLINPNVVFDYVIDLNEEETAELIDYLLSLKDRRVDPNTVLDSLLMDYSEDSENVREIAIKKILKDSRIKIKNVLNAIKDLILDENITIENYLVLDRYLDFIKEKQEIQRLRNIIVSIYDNITGYGDEVVEHIYRYLFKDMISSLPQILSILNTKKFSNLEYDKILDFIKYM